LLVIIIADSSLVEAVLPREVIVEIKLFWGDLLLAEGVNVL